MSYKLSYSLHNDLLKDEASQNAFFSMLSRMKYVNRWGIMKNIRTENIQEHSLETAIIAHALAVIKNEYFGGNINCERVALLAIFHDVTEIVTSDLPTPVKYHSSKLKQSYDEIEHIAKQELLSLLPLNMRHVYKPLLGHTQQEDELWKIVKAADRISALIKCIEERNMGNADFLKAEKSIMDSIKDMNMKEVDYFIENFLPSYSLSK